MKLNSRKLALTAVFTGLYAALVYALPGISFQLFQVRIADALIPLSIVLGWPVVFGVTIGCVISNVISPLPSVIIDITLGSIANFLASFLAWKVGSWKSIEEKLNGVAVIGATLAALSLILPWFTLSPLEAILRLGKLPPEWASDILVSLSLAGVCLALGACLGFLGACIKGKMGRTILVIATIVSALGVISFYNAYAQGPSIMHLLPLEGGFCLAAIASICLSVAILLHSMAMVEAKEYMGCITATIVITFVVGTYLALITNMELWMWWLGIGVGSIISISVLGYSLILHFQGLKVLQKT